MNTTEANPTLFYKSAHHEAIWCNFGSEKLVVTFAPRKEPTPAEFFGQDFLEKERISYVVIRTMDNTWYLNDDMDELLAAVRARIDESGAKQVTLFGPSMGSFGCIRATNALRPNKIIICAPVVTLDPAIERRWMSDYDHMLPAYLLRAHEMLPLVDGVEVFAIYDPDDKDAEHVDILSKTNPLTRIEIRGAGHMVLQYLRDSGTLGKVIRLLLGQSVNLKDVSALLTRSRKQNKSHLLNLSQKLDKRGKLQAIVLSYALRRFPDDIDVLLAKAGLLARAMQFQEASEIIERVATRHGRRSLGVSLGRALAVFVQKGGDPARVEQAAGLFASPQPRARGAQIWYSRFLRHCKRWDEAYLSHEQFMGGDAFEAHAHIERGLILESRQLLYAARLEFEVAARLAPDFAQAKHQLARITKLLNKSTP